MRGVWSHDADEVREAVPWLGHVTWEVQCQLIVYLGRCVGDSVEVQE